MATGQQFDNQTREERATERWQELDIQPEVDANLFFSYKQFDDLLGDYVTIMTNSIMDNANETDVTKGLPTLDGLSVLTALKDGRNIVEMFIEATGETKAIDIKRKPTSAEFEHNLDESNERIAFADFTGKRFVKFIEKVQTYDCSHYLCDKEIGPGDIVTMTNEWDDAGSRSTKKITFMCDRTDHPYPKREYTPAGKLHEGYSK
jgi:hypothetical protein